MTQSSAARRSRVSDSIRIPVQQVKRLKHMPAGDRSKTKCLYQRTDTGISMQRWPTDCHLLTQAQLLDQDAITVGVFALQVIEQLATTAHHAQQTAAAVVILRVGLEVKASVR